MEKVDTHFSSFPESNEIGNDFVSSSCWIQGIYVYEEMIDRAKKVGYFGMPKDMDEEGIMRTSNELCHLRPKLGVPTSPDCMAMSKTFFLQVCLTFLANCSCFKSIYMLEVHWIVYGDGFVDMAGFTVIKNNKTLLFIAPPCLIIVSNFWLSEPFDWFDIASSRK